MHIFSTLKELLRPLKKETTVLNNDNGQNKQNQGQQKEYKESKAFKSAESFGKPKFKNNEEVKSNCYVLFLKDGDTFVGMHNQEKKTFRLAGINTPEIGEQMAKESTDFLKEKISKKLVYLTFLGVDLYNREIVEVFLDKEKTQNVNKMLIKQGFASSERYKNSEGENTHSIVDYVQNEVLEKIVQFQGKGVWSDDIKKEQPKVKRFPR